MKQLLKRTKLKLLKDKYSIVGIPIKQFNKLDFKKFQKKFFSVVYGDKEITLIINEKNWNSIKNNFKRYKVEKNYRILTLDVNLSLDVVGYLAVISTILASNKISIGVISSYSKDHLLIKNKDVKKALKVLKEIKK